MATIAQNLQSLVDDRTNIASAISNKGVTVPSGSGYDDFASLIASIPSALVLDETKIGVVLLDQNGELTSTVTYFTTVADTKTFLNGKYSDPLTTSQRFFVNIGNQTNIDKIESNGFNGCTNLVSINLPSSIEIIESNGFNSCSNLKTVTHNNPSMLIGKSAFRNCSSLISFEIPANATSIEEYTFASCSSLVSITIPDSVTIIGEGAFLHCAFTMFCFPPNIREIKISVLRNCSNLKQVIIPYGVIDIKAYAFENDTSLTLVVIPSSVSSIWQNSFNHCDNLTTIVVQKAANSITSSPWGATNASIVWTG